VLRAAPRPQSGPGRVERVADKAVGPAGGLGQGADAGALLVCRSQLRRKLDAGLAEDAPVTVSVTYVAVSLFAIGGGPRESS